MGHHAIGCFGILWQPQATVAHQTGTIKIVGVTANGKTRVRHLLQHFTQHVALILCVAVVRQHLEKVTFDTFPSFLGLALTRVCTFFSRE